jgi:predicted nucleotidyltransferase
MSAVDRTIRVFKLGEEPSMVDEYERFSIDERLELFQQFRVRMIGDDVRLNTDWRDFIALLQQHGVEFLIVGGGAVNAHGFVRMTEDLDFWLSRTAENAERVMRAVREFGWDDSAISAHDLMQPGQVFMLGRKPNRIDLLTTISGVEFEQAYPRRVVGMLDGVQVPLIGLDDLLANKRATGRLRDLGDVEEFEKSRKYRK